MLLSELLGTHVVTTEGDELGRVHDVLLVQDGPIGANGRAQLRLHALAVGRRSLGTRLGYAQGKVDGPWILRTLFRKRPMVVPWSAIVRRGHEEIQVDASRLDR
jgi:hypothetical protein